MAFKQPRVPEYRGGNDFLRTLMLWLKDFANDVWTATRMTDKELAGIQSPVTSVNEKTGAVELGAADVGARPDTWTPTARDVGALGKSETAADAAKLGGKAAAYYLQPRNLLDNSDFTRPVNQRGRTAYMASDYTVDRWFLWSESGKASANLENGYIALNPNGDANVTLSQRFPKGELSREKTYTFAYQDTTGKIHIGWNSVTWGDAYDHVQIVAQGWIGVRWAALYEGEYTADTLPPYGPKGYAAELAECQRYYRHLTYSAQNWGVMFKTLGDLPWVMIPQNAPMRINPSAVCAGLQYYDGGWKDIQAGYIEYVQGVYKMQISNYNGANSGVFLIKGFAALSADL